MRTEGAEGVEGVEEWVVRQGRTTEPRLDGGIQPGPFAVVTKGGRLAAGGAGDTVPFAPHMDERSTIEGCSSGPPFSHVTRLTLADLVRNPRSTMPPFFDVSGGIFGEFAGLWCKSDTR